MTEQSSFVQDKGNDTKDAGETSFTEQDQQSSVDKKSIEGQLSIVQKRLDDQLDFIETLKNENKVLREQTDSNDKIEDLLSRLNTSQIEDTGQQEPNSPMNIDDLRDQGFVTKQDLEQQRLDSTYADNFSKVKSAMIDSYGEDKYLDILQGKAIELGMSVEDIDTLARSNPTAAIKLMEANKSIQPGNSSTQGSLNTQAIDNFNNSQVPTAPKSVMFGSTTKDVQANWRAAGDIVKKQMEQGNQFG